MNERIPASGEKFPIPSEASVREIIKHASQERLYVEVRRSMDDKGLCRLVLQMTNSDGDKLLFDYIREGAPNKDGTTASQTSIDIIVWDDNDRFITGSVVATYCRGVWEME